MKKQVMRQLAGLKAPIALRPHLAMSLLLYFPSIAQRQKKYNPNLEKIFEKCVGLSMMCYKIRKPRHWR